MYNYVGGFIIIINHGYDHALNDYLGTEALDYLVTESFDYLIVTT